MQYPKTICRVYWHCVIADNKGRSGYYDALLTEDGQITRKYREFQKVISKYAELPQIDINSDIQKKAYGKVEVRRNADQFHNLKKLAVPKHSLCPQSMDYLVS